ncbi:MAG: hypothetical protein HYY32_05185 [Chloroflexi bacterium]|nr:hypothetical protein [Chloroflexota bacterium]
MKRLKTSMAVFGIGGAIVLTATFGAAYFNQSQEQEQLRQELSQTNARIAKLPSLPSNDSLIAKRKDLDASIAQAKSDYDSTKTRLRAKLDSIEIAATLSQIASDSGVAVTGTESPGPAVEQLKGQKFASLTVTTRAQGDVPRLVDFVSKVTARFPTASIKSAELTVPDTTGKEARLPSVAITMTVYSYEGD